MSSMLYGQALQIRPVSVIDLSLVMEALSLMKILSGAMSPSFSCFTRKDVALLVSYKNLHLVPKSTILPYLQALLCTTLKLIHGAPQAGFIQNCTGKQIRQLITYVLYCRYGVDFGVQ